jgi:hypothetical protein
MSECLLLNLCFSATVLRNISVAPQPAKLRTIQICNSGLLGHFAPLLCKIQINPPKRLIIDG